MKKFSNYQYVPVREKNERDKKEEGSKFWNKGKWDNFVLPFLPDECEELTLVDIGCNAGVFLELAENKGFGKVIGVDNNKPSIDLAKEYRKKIGGKYELRLQRMETILDDLPVSDYIVMAMTHYYSDVGSWMTFLDKLMTKTTHCIIVTAKKREKLSKASADTKNIRDYFRFWEEVGYVPELPLEGDPFPRRQWSFCFRNPILERVSLDDLECLNPDASDFYSQVASGVRPVDTKYHKRISVGRRRKWNEEKLAKYVNRKADLFNDIRNNGLLTPILVNSRNQVIDGAHRYYILKELGERSIIARRVV